VFGEIEPTDPTDKTGKAAKSGPGPAPAPGGKPKLRVVK